MVVIAGNAGPLHARRAAHHLVDLTIQRDALTEEWRARFCDEYRNVDDIDPLE
jgi:hypothetical protein